MGALAKNLIPERVQSSPGLAPVSALFLDDSPLPVPLAELNKVQDLSDFLPILVLIPKSRVTDEAVPRKTAGKFPTQKPQASELLRRFDEALRQLGTASAEREFAFGPVTLNFSTMEASRNGECVALTAMEFKVLKYLIRNERRVISRDELLHEVWGYDHYPCTRTVDNHILNLRKKLEREPSRPRHFQTVHGVGYKFLS